MKKALSIAGGVAAAVRDMFRDPNAIFKHFGKFIALAIRMLLMKGLKMLLASLTPLLPALMIVIAVGGVLIAAVAVFDMWIVGDDGPTDPEIVAKIKERYQAAAESTVDPDKPEQLPFMVPPAVIAAFEKIDFIKTDSDGISRRSELDIHPEKYAQALKADFHYQRFYDKHHTWIIKETEVYIDGVYDRTTGRSESKSTKDVPRDLLVQADAWNGQTKITYRLQEGSWTLIDKTVKEKCTTRKKKDEEYEVCRVTTTWTYEKLDTWVQDTRSTNYTIAKINDLFAQYGFTKDDQQLFYEMLQSASVTAGMYGGLRGGLPTNLALSLIPAEFMEIYKQAEERYGVPWNVLAAIHAVETNFSQNLGVSSAGAVGHMQFMPATWVGWKYAIDKVGRVSPTLDITDLSIIREGGGYGQDANGDGKADPWDVWDAIFTAAYYLERNGAKEDLRKAIFAYNHANWYVEEVMAKAQAFAEFGTAYNGRYIYPVSPVIITSYYSYRKDPFTGEKKKHNGVDFGSRQGAGVPIYASRDGVVTRAEYSESYGYVVYINHDDGYQTRYAHMLPDLQVKKGDRVKAGDVIGYMGSTGRATGVHLHFEIRNERGEAVNPLDFLGQY